MTEKTPGKEPGVPAAGQVGAPGVGQNIEARDPKEKDHMKTGDTSTPHRTDLTPR